MIPTMIGVIAARRQDIVRDGNLRTTQNYVETIFKDDGALRTTQNYVETIYQDTGSLRTTQNYVEVVTDYY